MRLIGDPQELPFRQLDRYDLFTDEQTALFDGLADLADACHALAACAAALAEFVGETASLSRARLRQIVASISAFPEPGGAVDCSLLTRLIDAEARREAQRLVVGAERARDAAALMRAAGIARPVASRADLLDAAAGLVTGLGLADARVGDVPEFAEQAASLLARWHTHARTMIALTGILLVERDPEIEVIDFAWRAAELAAKLDAPCHPHRSPGRERHAVFLSEVAKQAEALEVKLHELSVRLWLDEVSAEELRAASVALRGAGLFDFMHAERRRAARVFFAVWRVRGETPRRGEWADWLDRAAEALDAAARSAPPTPLCAQHLATCGTRWSCRWTGSRSQHARQHECH